MRIHVRWRASASLAGTVMRWLSVPLALPLLLALYYGERPLPLLLPMIITVIVGLALERLESDPDLGPAEAFLMVGST